MERSVPNDDELKELTSFGSAARLYGLEVLTQTASSVRLKLGVSENMISSQFSFWKIDENHKLLGNALTKQFIKSPYANK